MEKWKQKLLLSYINNFINNRHAVKNKMVNFIEWYQDYWQKYFNFTYHWLSKNKQNDDFSDFHDLKKDYLAGVKGFREKISQRLVRYASLAKSPYEQKADVIGQLLGLSEEEKEILCALWLFKTESEFERFSSAIEDTREDVFDVLPYFLGMSEYKFSKYTDGSSPLCKFGLIDHKFGDTDLTDVADKLASSRIRTISDIKECLIGKTLKANLEWHDFGYIEEKGFCAKLLKRALSSHAKGVNILLYGTHGTGKTEFAKTLVQHVNAEFYGLGENFDNDDSRKEKLDLAHRLLEKDKNTCLLIDEADDFLEGSSCFHYRSRNDNNKLYVNRALENNRIPAIWIVNDIEELDKAFLRRFTFAINFSKPTLKTRTQMWQKALKQNHLPDDEKTAENFAIQYRLSPSFIATAVKSAKLARGGLEEVKQSLNALEKAYSNGRSHCPILKKETDFNVELLNTDTDLKKLAEQICRLPQRNFSLCLYGASGTGKSAYAEYLAGKIGIPFIKKRCSDLLSMWVGGTEKNIARAFEEGRDNQAMLVFDEADSFLQDRTGANRSWEVTQVNEMLTQMETYPYPFVCTTNLMDRLDKASLRRFTFKVGYEYMTAEQSNLAFEHFFGMKDIDLSHLNSLTPGDFVVVKQKAQILGVINDCEELVKMLELEQKNKTLVGHRMGFVLEE